MLNTHVPRKGDGVLQALASVSMSLATAVDARSGSIECAHGVHFGNGPNHECAIEGGQWWTCVDTATCLIT